MASRVNRHEVGAPVKLNLGSNFNRFTQWIWRWMVAGGGFGGGGGGGTTDTGLVRPKML